MSNRVTTTNHADYMFCNLNSGDMFEYEGNNYMKISMRDDSSDSYALDLEDGRMEKMDVTTRIKSINQFTINSSN